MSHWITVTVVRPPTGSGGTHSGVRSDKDYGIGHGGGIEYRKDVKVRGTPKYPDGFGPAPKHKRKKGH